MLGREPEGNATSSLASYRYLIKEMHKSYLDICAHLRYCLERDIDPNLTPSGIWRYKDDEEIIGLPSIELKAQFEQVAFARNRQSYVQYRYHALSWLDGAIDKFDSQRFTRDQISDWLFWKELDSEFDFERVEVLTPEMRREEVRRLMLECSNNKSEVARRLGVSRTRVDQLLSSDKMSKRKALQLQAQDPFGLARRP